MADFFNSTVEVHAGLLVLVGFSGPLCGVLMGWIAWGWRHDG